MSEAVSRAASEQNGNVSPKLSITMAGCLSAFLVIVIGFLLVARRKKHRTPSLPVLPVTHNHRGHQLTRRGIALPVATTTNCPACSKPSGKGLQYTRTSYESLCSLASLPPYTRNAPTGASAIRLETWRSTSSSSSSSSFSSASSPTTPSPTTPQSPSTPPPAYVGRGPTASVRRAPR